MLLNILKNNTIVLDNLITDKKCFIEIDIKSTPLKIRIRICFLEINVLSHHWLILILRFTILSITYTIIKKYAKGYINILIKIYFWTRFGLANAINGYLRIKICVVISSYQIWVRYIFFYQKSLKQTLKTCFCIQNHLLNLCTCIVNSQRLFCYQKADFKYLY